MAQTTAQLVIRWQQGDQDAVAELVDRFRTWAIDVAYAILQDRDLAEDAGQEAFLTAFQQLPQLRTPAAFPGWLRRIVRTQAYRILRKKREQPLDQIPGVFAREPSPPQSLQHQEICLQTRRAIQALPRTKRETATFFYLDEMSCAEVAHRLAVPPGTVKRRLHDVRRQMKSILLGSIDGTKADVQNDLPL